MRDKLLRILRWTTVAAFWLAVWSGVCYAANRSLLLPLPYPWDVAKALWLLMGEAPFWTVVGTSLLRIVTGFSAALLVGIALAMLTTRFSVLNALIAPVLSIVRAAPVASFIFVAFLWIRAEDMPTCIAFLMVVPLVWENVRQGILRTDCMLLEMAQVFRLSRWARLRHIRFPALRPYLQAAVYTVFGFAWKAGVAAEVLAVPRYAIGTAIFESNLYLYTDTLFAYALAALLLSALIEWLVLKFIPKGESL